jgi:Flp pilus assembly protein TadG
MTVLGKKWVRETGGAAAVEFAMIAFPFIFLTIGIIELSVMFLTQSVLHDATFSASRMIRTGQLQMAGGSQETFEDEVCNTASIIIPCNELQYQVQALPSFSDAEDIPPEFDDEGKLQNTGFDPGEENDVVLIRVAYNYPVKTPLMQPILANNGATRVMFSTIVLRTEPYQ